MSPRTYVRIMLAAAMAILSPSVFGQGQGGGTSTGGGGGATGGGAGVGTTPTPAPTRTTTPTPPTQPTQPQQQQMEQPIFISGRVMLEDGTPPPDTAAIERVCNGQPRSEGYTDSKGYFGFELGQKNNRMIHDASEDPNNDPFNRPSGFGATSSNTSGSSSMLMCGTDTRLMGCELRARLAGYRSQI